MSRSGVATALAEQGEREQALQILQVGRAMIARLKARSPDNATLAEDLACFDVQIAEASKRDAKSRLGTAAHTARARKLTGWPSPTQGSTLHYTAR